MTGLRQRVTVGADGLIVIRVPELKAGSRAEVIVVGHHGGTGDEGAAPQLEPDRLLPRYVPIAPGGG
jgi:hypothetical protein